MTVIFRAYTSEGFLVAADGLVRSDSGKVISKAQQKIFPIRQERVSIAYSMMGWAAFTPDDNDAEIIFDFIPEIKSSADRLDGINKYKDAHAYCQALAQSVFKTFSKAISIARGSERAVTFSEDEEETPGEAGKTIVRLFFDGYYDKKPFQIDVRFFHRDQVLNAPVTYPLVLRRGWHLRGPHEMNRLLFGDGEDSRFLEYRAAVPKKEAKHLTLNEAIDTAKSYIRACESDAGRSVDPKRCPGIGGHIHAAKVTSEYGFDWMPGYAPILQSANPK